MEFHRIGDGAFRIAYLHWDISAGFVGFLRHDRGDPFRRSECRDKVMSAEDNYACPVESLTLDGKSRKTARLQVEVKATLCAGRAKCKNPGRDHRAAAGCERSELRRHIAPALLYVISEVERVRVAQPLVCFG